MPIIKKHWPVIFLALLVGSLTAFPQILAVRSVADFQGIYKTVNNDELYYLARSKDVIDGHATVANPYLYEHKDKPPVQIGLPDYLLAKPLAVFGIGLHRGYFFYDFILPALGTILTYGIIYLLTRSVLISFLGASLLHLNFFLYAFNRSPSPQFNFLFWLALLWLWLKFLERPTTSLAVMAGVNLGLLFYVYPYYWTYYVVFFGLYLLLGFMFKQLLPYKKYLIIFSVAALVAVPYFINLWHSLNLPYYDETLARIGLISTHFPSGRKIVMWAGLTIVIIFMAYWRKIVVFNQKSLLLFAGTLAAPLVTNQHLITGKNLQFASHYWQLSVFISVFAGAFLFAQWYGTKRKTTPNLGLVVLGLIAIFVFYRPAVYVTTLAAEGGLHYTSVETAQQRYASIFDWLRRNTEKDDVVFANNGLSVLIPIYTANNVFFQGLANLHFMSNQEVWERFILNNYWDKIDADYAVKNRFSIWGAYYLTRYDHNQSKNKVRRWLGLSEKVYIKYPPEAVEEFLIQAERIQTGDFETQLSKYRVDYFVYDKSVDKWPIEKLSFLRPVFEFNNLTVYHVE